MSLNISSKVSLKFSGKDAFSFVDSLISNSIPESEIKFSYLLGPDGKVMFWFICSLNNQEFKMYQSLDVLEKMTEVFNKYKIRIDCEIEIINEVSNFIVQIDDDKLNVIPSNKLENNNSWDMLGLSLELPLKNIIDNGILPNEVSWLENFVDYFKGCFMGQEQTSRVKYRGRPRRILKSLPNSTQEIVKI